MKGSTNTQSPDFTQLGVDGWQRMLALTGLGEAPPITGWDHLVRAVLDAPTARIKPERRIEAISHLLLALSQLRTNEFKVLVLRFGMTIDDRPAVHRSRREVSRLLELSHSRIAQLERSGLDALRAQFDDPATSLEQFVDLHAESQ